MTEVIPPSPHRSMSPKAMSGIRVVEVGQFVTGPEAGVLLADLGADVIKVESVDTGDPFRQWGAGGYAPNFCSLNRNKRSLALNFVKPEGLAVLLRLLSSADVVIENFRPGQTERWGWGYETVHALNPRIVYCSISGFGQSGPYRDRPGYDTIGQAMSGLLSVLTELDDPEPMGISLSDHLTGIYAAYGIMGALFARERTGLGQRVDTSLLQSTIAFMSENIATYYTSGDIPTQKRRARGAGVWAFVAGDELPFVIHLSSPPKFWESLASTVGHPEWITDPRFLGRADRRKNYDELKELLNGEFKSGTREQWLERLVNADVPCAPINTLEEVFADPQIAVLQMHRTITHPIKGEVHLASPGVNLSATPLEWELAPPMLGEHTDEVLTSLGYDNEEIAALFAKSIVSDSTVGDQGQ
ncbi:MAG TPA: CoA transferase [Acidimicrobiales bacterium]|nr:CoA transferase [Acidimicrobiales bacterium]